MSGENQSGGPIAPELLTTAEAARLCGIGERTLWRWSRCGIAPGPLKIGSGKNGAVRFRRDDYLEWIRAGCPRVDRRAGR
jgi:predicted DNA-binding transcriptional regulator AlpA